MNLIQLTLDLQQNLTKVQAVRDETYPRVQILVRPFVPPYTYTYPLLTIYTSSDDSGVRYIEGKLWTAHILPFFKFSMGKKVLLNQQTNRI